MTCDFMVQPLNHFSLPRGDSPSFRQRYCVSNEFVVDPSSATVFFYTGNESPLEEYINNTGLMWELAETFNAQIVFVEHRYEGMSLPSPDITNCMAYSSSIQAIADYANFIERKLFASDGKIPFGKRRPVIAFGGSYGGMLSAWMRMKYPNIIAGSIAGSAPIWGFPLNFPNKIDSAWRVILSGLKRNYPPTDSENKENHCAENLLAAWSIMKYLGQQGSSGLDVLTTSFRMCSPLEEKDVDVLIEWAQSPWFDLAEGSFPYPSSYIPFALTHNDKAALPAWPLQAACWKQSDLYSDLGIRLEGDLSEVKYDLFVKDQHVLSIDWDKLDIVTPSLDDSMLKDLSNLLTQVRDAVSIWYSITQDLTCYDLVPAPNKDRKWTVPVDQITEERSLHRLGANLFVDGSIQSQRDAAEDCRTKMLYGSWPSLCCNEDMNLIITEARGLGRDFLWPPSHRRGTESYVDTVEENATDPFCDDPFGDYGYPHTPSDPWSTQYDVVYGGVNIGSHSNIIFSNGLLDPWSAAGVYKTDPTPSGRSRPSQHDSLEQGLYLQELNDNDLVALIMEYGGHHTDLMYSSDKDPPSIRMAREIEQKYISKWVETWWK